MSSIEVGSDREEAVLGHSKLSKLPLWRNISLLKLTLDGTRNLSVRKGREGRGGEGGGEEREGREGRGGVSGREGEKERGNIHTNVSNLQNHKRDKEFKIGTLFSSSIKTYKIFVIVIYCACMYTKLDQCKYKTLYMYISKV